ncbi:hypothetical protein P691DRAFT_732347 [Macrolepiota fuliginosa MF-IS2]|uniref:Uncharacterized protein n=1 Tax=Macrolepiota fuliginosa MF-IS2 TaxID=1400762 RepID=A0A9P5XA51_9AGAR|nr:hypothetical protein P691DRAFT_732347 [Macrolepiota fuliginosa MF-IS2]
MSALRTIFARLLPTKNYDYELVGSDSHQHRNSQPRYLSSAHILRRVFTLRNVLIAIPTALALLVTAILLNGGIPPLYADIRGYEKALPQHNVTFSQHSGVRYLAFPHHIWGHGWNNVLQEYLMLSYLAYITNRSFVFDDYTWSHSPFPYTLYDFALRPSRLPLNAFIAGPIAGGPIPTSPGAPPRAVNSEFWQVMCSREKRRVIKQSDAPSGLMGRNLVDWWKDTIQKHEDVVCLEVDTRQNPIFDFNFFGGQQLLDIWPSLSETAILSHFKWSPLVLSAVERNFVILPDLRDAHVSVLRRRLSSTRINHSAIPRASPTDSAFPSKNTYPALLAIHIRRGDYSRHCPRLAEWGVSFHGFNSFEGLPDRWVPYDGPLSDDAHEKIDYYRKHCFPSQEEVVERLHTIRAEHDAFISEHARSNHTQLPMGDSGSPSPSHQLQRVFVLTNAWPSWLSGLKRKLIDDGWEDVIVSGDLILDPEQKGVDVAVDMSIAEKAEVFVGNGFSSLSGNIVMLRTAQGLHVQTNRFL